MTAAKRKLTVTLNSDEQNLADILSSEWDHISYDQMEKVVEFLRETNNIRRVQVFGKANVSIVVDVQNGMITEVEYDATLEEVDVENMQDYETGDQLSGPIVDKVQGILEDVYPSNWPEATVM